MAALEAYEQEGLIDRSQKLGQQMMLRLQQIQEKHPSVGDVRGKGLFTAVELVRDQSTREPLTPFNSKSSVMARIVAEARERGVSFFARWNFFMLSPPLVISEEDLHRGLDLLDELLVLADAEVA